jgi:hypothetical protein
MRCGDLVHAIEINDNTKRSYPLQVFNKPPDWSINNAIALICEVTHEHPLIVLNIKKIQYKMYRKKIPWVNVITPFGVGWVNGLELEPI